MKKTIPEIKYTADMIKEVHRCSTDPVYFISNYCYIQDPVDGKILFKLRDYQEEIVRAFVENRKVIWAGTRQEGRTTILAAYSYWFAIFKFDKACMVASVNNASSHRVRDLVGFMHENVPDFLKCGVRHYNKHCIEFANGSRILFNRISSCMGRGLTLSLLALDDLVHADVTEQHEMWASIYPCLASTYGECIVAANPTPLQHGDLFNEIWAHAQSNPDNFFPIKTDVTKMVERSEDWKNYMKAMLGAKNFAHEYEISV